MIRFDDAIEATVAVLRRRFPDELPRTTLVREPAGAITMVLPDDALAEGQWAVFAAELDTALGRFSPGLRSVLLRQRDLIDPQDILNSPDGAPWAESRNLRLVDRLLTNQDWLRSPAVATPPIPAGTAFSIKGGVGRSTALAVLAWHLARLGRKVLIMDLDLEAPGMGSLLLPELPEFGVVDWCVESLVDQADVALLEQMLAPAPLAEGTDGQILLAPAFGRRTGDFVAKLGRAYLPTMDEDGRVRGLADRINAFIAQAAKRLEPPDVVLLDARAGLHDIGSAAVTQLGAQVFLFARDEAQSWDAYRHLFDHLRRSPAVVWGMPDEDLRWRLKMVAAQVDPTVHSTERWLDRSYSTWAAFYDGAKDEGSGSAAEPPTVFERREQAAPHFPLQISFDPRIRGINLIDPQQRPEWQFIETAFGPFLEGAVSRLLPELDSPLETLP